jgi:hypothetical protein
VISPRPLRRGSAHDLADSQNPARSVDLPLARRRIASAVVASARSAKRAPQALKQQRKTSALHDGKAEAPGPGRHSWGDRGVRGRPEFAFDGSQIGMADFGSMRRAAAWLRHAAGRWPVRLGRRTVLGSSAGENPSWPIAPHIWDRWRSDGFRCTQTVLEQDDLPLNRYPALAYCWSMIFSENRYPLFGIML